MITIGSSVKRLRPYDGSKLSGKPYGKVLVIVSKVDNPKYVSAMNGIDSYYVLSDGSWDTEHNLMEV